MATKQYNVDEALEPILNDEFGLSDGDLSDKEEGEDYNVYLGEPVVPPNDIEALTHNVVSGDDADDDDGDDACPSDGSLTELDPSDGSPDEEDLLGLTGICSDLPGVICTSIATIVTVSRELRG